MSRTRIKAIIRQFAQNGMKLLLEDPANVRELLTIPEFGLLDQIDFDHMTRLRTSFIQRDYRHVEADVVLRAPLQSSGKERRKRTITIYILIEHQSAPDPMMIFRVLEYVVQIYRAQARDWGRQHRSFAGLRLNPVVPIVFYTGTRSWDTLGQLVDLIEMGEEFAPVIPALDPLFLNLSTVPASKLEAAGGFGWVLRLVQQRHARPEEFQDLLRRAVEHLEAIPARERLRWLELLSYIQALVYHERNPAERSGLQRDIEASVRAGVDYQEISVMGKTIADELRNEGRKQEAVRLRRHILLEQLRERFGELPDETVAAVRSTKATRELDTWLRRIVTATKLEDIGIGL